jgi:hypothetical protein
MNQGRTVHVHGGAKLNPELIALMRSPRPLAEVAEEIARLTGKQVDFRAGEDFAIFAAVRD